MNLRSANRPAQLGTHQIDCPRALTVTSCQTSLGSSIRRRWLRMTGGVHRADSDHTQVTGSYPPPSSRVTVPHPPPPPGEPHYHRTRRFFRHLLKGQNHHPRVLPKASQWKVVSMCKRSRSSGAGPRNFTPIRSDFTLIRLSTLAAL